MPILESDRPGMDFADGYPLGNGRIGLMCFGGPGRLVFVVNHYDLWSRPKVHLGPRPGLWENVRGLAREGQWAQCSALATSAFKEGRADGHGVFEVGAYVEIWPVLPDGALSYRRRLDTHRGVAECRWSTCGHTYAVRAWPDARRPAATIQLTTTAPEGFRARVRLYRPHDPRYPRPKVWGKADELGLRMRLVQNLHYAVALGAKRAFDEDSIDTAPFGDPRAHEGVFRWQSVMHPDLEPHANVEAALLGGTRRITLRTAIEVARGRAASVRATLPARPRGASATPEAAKKTLGRARIELPGDPDDPAAPAYAQRLFDLGRDLFTTMTFPGGLPPNLQGIWNNRVLPPCFSDYHMDLNLQMSLWHVPTGNLLEYHEPLFRLVEQMVPGARKNAKHVFRMRGLSFPGCSYGQGEGRKHADCYVGISGWLLEHFWTHWRYTLDLGFLRDRTVPILRDVCRFYLDYLQEEDGRLIISPSISPENRIPQREHAQMGRNSTFDLSVFAATFRHTIEALRLVGRPEDALAREAAAALGRLAPYPRDPRGALMELEDYQWEKGHRHLSHLHPVFPLGEITPESGEPFKAAQLALERFESFPPTGTEPWMQRMGYDTWAGWTYVLLALTHARMGNGDRALELLERFGRFFRTDGGLGLCFANEDFGFGLNFEPKHGKWIQVDAMLGAVAAVQEMLLQSHNGVIRILPALPRSWKSGQFRGLRAELGFQIDAQWERGRLREARIRSLKGRTCRLKCPGRHTYRVRRSRGAQVSTDRDPSNGIITFPTRRNTQYTVTPADP